MAVDNIARGMAYQLQSKIEGLASVKNNLNATSEPSVSDDKDSGYAVGSIWVYNGETYTCADNETGKAVWTSSSEEVYFDDWLVLISEISQVGTTYVGKYAHVANANGGISSGLTYTYPNPLIDYIVDGGSAIFKINAQGEEYSVSCLTRTVTNPVVTSVMLTATTKPTIKGYYIFSVVPTDGLPLGCSLNDICYFDGTNWSVFQKYSVASAVLVAGTTTNTQVTWRKFNGRWMSTADSYVPDGNEYQTGKLWNDKAVYRKCISGTTQSTVDNNSHTVGISVPTTGTIIIVMGTITRTSGTKQTVVGGTGAVFAVDSSGNVIYNSASDTAWSSIPFTVWCEYTKS